jgi:quinol-cytochrome oxidoreductase complex cytochrome b subunit
MAPNIPHQIKQAHPNLPPHMQAMIAAQQGHPQQGPRGPYVPRPPRSNYIRRTVRTIVFGFLTLAFMSAAVASYLHAHRTGYAPLAQTSTAAGHYPNPLLFLLIGVFFGLLAFLQARKIITVRKTRNTARTRPRV